METKTLGKKELKEALIAQFRMWRYGKILQDGKTTKILDQEGLTDEDLANSILSLLDMDSVAMHFGYRKVIRPYIEDCRCEDGESILGDRYDECYVNK